jgi:hypothetical protein
MSRRDWIPGTIDRPEASPVETAVPFAFVHINKCGGSSVEIALGIQKDHASARTMRNAMGDDEWARRFTFSLVRNPFDRVVSIYYYRVRARIAGLEDRHVNINQWIAKVWDDRDPAYLDDALLLGPAEDWLCEDGALMVDFVGKLETLDEDWKVVTDRLGIDKSLERVNRNARPPYRDVLDTTARAVIEKSFRADFERYGYDW